MFGGGDQSTTHVCDFNYDGLMLTEEMAQYLAV